MGKGRGGYGGFGGGMPSNMNNLLKQAQKMQKQMEEAQQEIETETAAASAGGGAVEAVVSGNREILSIKIDKDVVDPDDVEMLEDLIVAACNEALRKMDELTQQRMSRITGGIGGAGGLF